MRSPFPGCCQEQRGSLPWLSVSMAMALRHPFSTATSTYAKSGLVLGSQGGNKCSEFSSPLHAGWPSHRVHCAELPIHVQHSRMGRMDKTCCLRWSVVSRGGAAKPPPASPTFAPWHRGVSQAEGFCHPVTPSPARAAPGIPSLGWCFKPYGSEPWKGNGSPKIPVATGVYHHAKKP